MRNAIVTFMIATLTSLTFAGDGLKNNDDIRYIKQWQRAQKMKELADLLDLDSTQVATLRTIKAQRDAIKEEMAPRVTELEERIATSAASMRARLENGGTLTDEDQEQIAEYKRERRLLNQERKARMATTMAELKAVLTQEQKTRLKEARQQRREERRAQREDAKAERHRNREDRHTRKALRRLGHALLSDAFLDSYN